jgi:tRNA 2-thiocytidine biosynthesis protein TtcA
VGQPSRLEHKLLDLVAKASYTHKLIEEGDRIMACLSGGKDSYAMVWLLKALQRKMPFKYELMVVNLDQGHPGFPGHVLEGWLVEQGLPYRMLQRDTYSVVTEKIPVGKTYCSLCSRLRRGILYDAAVDLGCNKMALGHHRDDIIETLLLNIFYSGQLKAMPPRLRSDDGRNIVIRPLAFCEEKDVAAFAAEKAFPVIPCDLCGSQENLQRKRVKALIAQLAAENEKVPGNMFAALGNVKASHLLDLGLRERLGMDEEAHGVDETVAALGATGACAEVK